MPWLEGWAFLWLVGRLLGRHELDSSVRCVIFHEQREIVAALADARAGQVLKIQERGNQLAFGPRISVLSWHGYLLSPSLATLLRFRAVLNSTGAGGKPRYTSGLSKQAHGIGPNITRAMSAKIGASPSVFSEGKLMTRRFL
jgi:hypothetical protein